MKSGKVIQKAEEFGWETEEERLKRFMKIPPRKKMEWLYEMHQFLLSLPKANQRLRLELRRSRFRQ